MVNNSSNSMHRLCSMVLVSSVFFLTSTYARQKDSNGQDVDTVRISTNLVQVDAVVLDKAGNKVTDLRPEDFQIFEDGRLQPITNFSYVTLKPVQAAQPSNGKPFGTADKNAPPPPPVRLRPEEVRRTVALVVDDLGLSFESVHIAREALKKFVDQQMQPGDLVAIVRTGGGVGALQQFTSDKQLLYAAIDRVKYSFLSRQGISAFSSVQDDQLDSFYKRPAAPGSGNTRPPIVADSDKGTEQTARENEKDFRDEIFSVGTLGALNFIVRGLKELPGRKSAILISDSLPLFANGESNDRVLTALRHLTDLANRASVNIYTIDARGLQTLGLTAADGSVSYSYDDQNEARKIEDRLSSLSSEMFSSQSGLNYLALQTGGFFVHNNNDISGGIKRVLDDQNGYYLIGYRPAESTFDAKTGARSFHKIAVTVNRPGFTVRSRSGFYGMSTEAIRPTTQTADQQLMSAVTSPFSSGELNMRLTSLFANDAVAGPEVRTYIYIDGKSISFSDEPDGSHKAVVDLLAMTFGDNGVPLDQRRRTETIHARGAEYDDVLKNGLLFGINLSVKKPGGYQLRVAARDATTQKLGSANQFIEVPNLTKNRLTLSGIYLTSKAARDSKSSMDVRKFSIPAQTNLAPSFTVSDHGDSRLDPAVRSFGRGNMLDYGVEIYNAQPDGSTGKPQLTTQIRLFRDNEPVFSSQELAVMAGSLTSVKRLATIGHIQLDSNIAPGEYVLQIIVTDALAKQKKYRTATQWITFDVN